MIIETIRNKKLLTLYTTLTGSDFKGNREDDELVKLLYSILCLEKSIPCDVNCDHIFKSGYDYVLLSKELIRLYETPTPYDGTIDEYSYEYLASRLLGYMLNYDKCYKDIHSMNSYELKKSVLEEM